jgi:serine/threonine protein kinase
VPVLVAISIAMQLLDALVAVHEHGIHAGVTPANVMITRSGTVKLADVGLARALHGVAPAKLGYLAPEAATGALLDARTDVFAVGVIAWELLAGRRLFDATSRDELLAMRDIPPPSRHNENCDASLDQVVLAALARRHDDRTPSALAMREALQPFAEHVETKRVAAWANLPVPRRSADSEPDIKVSIDDGSKQIEIASYLVDRPKPVLDDTYEEESKDMVIVSDDDHGK